MRRLKRTAGGLASAVTVAGLLAVTHDAVATTVEGGQPGATFRQVTLVTGDRVTVLDGNAFAVEPGAGRAGTVFQTRRAGGHLSVIPGDAAALVGAGQLDPRLFDVTTLLEFGYDDRRGDLPLVVMKGKAKAAVPTTGATVDHQLPKLNAVALRQDRKKPGAFWQGLTGGAAQPRKLTASVSKVWLDGVRKPTLDVSVPQIGAPTAWQAGYTGSGVTVAVLDTGIDDTHPDLAGKVTARGNFTDGEEDDRDVVGHGTHVASTIAGSGAASSGKYRGVAPDTKLLDGKVCVTYGCAESWILAGMEWAAVEQHAKVVNMSLGGRDTPEIDPLEQAVNTLTEQYGTLFVIAAGNDGPASGTVGSPGSAEAALTVGAVDKSDKLAAFSSRGPQAGDGAVKPDITAPGVAITAARGRDATEVGGEAGDAYVTLSGTSMASPHVAGAAAILAQQHPDWTPGRLKAALVASAKPVGGVDVFGQGAGRVDVAKAISQTVTAEPVSVSFGKQLWPHADDEVLTRAVTYHNSGAAPVTLATAVDSTGTFNVAPTSVTVPAGGDAKVTLTADTRAPGPDGVLAGVLTATGDGQSVRTPLAVEKEAESYDLTIHYIDPDGGPSAEYQTALANWDGKGGQYIYGRGSGTVTVRAKPGRYALTSWFLGPEGAERPEMTMLNQPVLELPGSRTITMDARLGKASSVTLPQPSATQMYASVDFTMQTADALTDGGAGIIGGGFDQLYTAQVGDTTPVEGFTSELNGTWAEAGAEGSGANSPYTYSTTHYVEGRMLSGYERTVTAKELAAVDTRYLSDGTGTFGLWSAVSRRPGQERLSSAVLLRYDAPSSAIHYYTTDGGVEWRSALGEFTDEDGQVGGLSTPYTHYEPRPYSQTWNQAVFGPVLAAPVHGEWNRWVGVVRDGNTISVDLPLYSDGAGHIGFGGDSGNTVLYRDGAKVGEVGSGGEGDFTVPAGDAAYRLEVHSERGTPHTLSTRTDATWTFRSAHVDDWAALALWAVRYTPKLGEQNTAPAGCAFTIPMTVSAQPGAQTGRLREVTVEVSYDDGATWTRAKMTGGAAVVQHPKGSGFVSLRAVAHDTAGNSLEQTIIRAYRYGETR